MRCTCQLFLVYPQEKKKLFLVPEPELVAQKRGLFASVQSQGQLEPFVAGNRDQANLFPWIVSEDLCNHHVSLTCASWVLFLSLAIY
jgi:hypothetical protein